MTVTVRPRSRAAHWPGVVAVALTATVTVMPGFTVGALATSIETDLGVSRSAVGFAMSCFYAATALSSPLAKRLAVRLSVPASLRIAALGASAVLLLTSQATGFAMLTAGLVVGGLSNALVQPAAGRLIAASVPSHRRSLAAGVVGAALAAATLIPGLLVAFVVPSHGWRVAMLIAGLVALAPVGFAPLTRIGSAPATATRRAAGVPRGLMLWALAAALSAAGNNAVASYFVQLGAEAGLTTVVTGNLLSCSAFAAIVVRISAGALTDLAPRHNPAVISAMMLAGALGLALIAVGNPVTFVLGAVLAFTAGWGWTGLLLATTLRMVPHRTEHAGHTVQLGVYAGAAVAPFTFGAVSTGYGFTGAALLTAVAAVLAAISMTAGTSLLVRPGR